MATYNMHLENEPFTKIKSGKKKVEMRLLDPKRSNLHAGDFIEFINRLDDDHITCKVISLYKFPTFSELYQNTDKYLMGYEEGESCSPHDMEKFYSIADQQKYGVVAIYIEIIR